MEMKLDKITVNFSSQKLQAIRLLKPELYDGIEKMLQEQLDKLYVRAVPPLTREYIEKKEKDDADIQKGGNK